MKKFTRLCQHSTNNNRQWTRKKPRQCCKRYCADEGYLILNGTM
ncbi:hypothetical protein QWZ13_11755 [Reinekea marina]|nr:hypothetical protein [Reinekea marina]MDN3649591.1 hypothetical protein [Reinekea marina]